jgi:hypothetical protein
MVSVWCVGSMDDSFSSEERSDWRVLANVGGVRLDDACADFVVHSARVAGEMDTAMGSACDKGAL